MGLSKTADIDERTTRNEMPGDPTYDPASGVTCNSTKEVLDHLNGDHVGESQCPSTNRVRGKRKSSDLSSATHVTVDIESSPEGLPPGWIKETRCTRSASRQRKDSYYRDPATGIVFRSRKEVLRYLETGKIGKNVIRRKDKVPSTMHSPPGSGAPSSLVNPVSCYGMPQASSGQSGGDPSSQSPMNNRSEPIPDRPTVSTMPESSNMEPQGITRVHASDTNLIHVAESGLVSGRVVSSGVGVVVGKPSPGMRYKKLAIRRPFRKKGTDEETKADKENQDLSLTDPGSSSDTDLDQALPNTCSFVDNSQVGSSEPSEKPNADLVQAEEAKKSPTENPKPTEGGGPSEQSLTSYKHRLVLDMD